MQKTISQELIRLRLNLTIYNTRNFCNILLMVRPFICPCNMPICYIYCIVEWLRLLFNTYLYYNEIQFPFQFIILNYYESYGPI